MAAFGAPAAAPKPCEQELKIVESFVTQFYQMFDGPTTRQQVLSLYQPTSVLSFEGENHTGQAAITQKFASLGLPQGVAHRVTSKDAQPSAAGSGAILAFVTGDFCGQKFQEVFHLVPSPQTQYYLHNNIFRVGNANQLNAPAGQGGDIAKAFVQHYYTQFDSNRDALASLYRANSVLSFEGENRVGVQPIVEKLKSLPKVTHDPNSMTIDSQIVSGNTFILVFLCGQLSIDGGNPMKFTQTFQLVQEGQGYYVGNDIFRLNYG